ncbi:hypothetical protein [Streptomyces fragilis]|uniref:hypothetical protein n=1 Tax=Streptomyces fragilis TaxID=67301 RepID=UPI0024DE868E|nr:hypothetical protein [Streptomyces fragilis]
MAQTRVRGEGRRRRSAGDAADLGWDDSLYGADRTEDGPLGEDGDRSDTSPRDAGRHGGGGGRGSRRRGSGGGRGRVLRLSLIHI